MLDILVLTVNSTNEVNLLLANNSMLITLTGERSAQTISEFRLWQEFDDGAAQGELGSQRGAGPRQTPPGNPIMPWMQSCIFSLFHPSNVLMTRTALNLFSHLWMQ